MALVECKECKAQISSSAPSCPKCGYVEAAIPAPQKEPRQLWPYFLGAALLLLFLFVVNSGGNDEKSQARMAIELCWKEQGRKSLDPSAARFAAGACELMEQRFKERFGHAP